MKTLIICASKYGSTLEIGRWLAERLGGDCLVDKAESMPAKKLPYPIRPG